MLSLLLICEVICEHEKSQNQYVTQDLDEIVFLQAAFRSFFAL